jgi:hypothetical protein
MQKSLIAAVLVGAASAGYSQTWNPVYVSGWFNMFIKADADAGYTTGYMGADGSTHTETYGVEIYSYANLTIGTEYFESYKHQIMFGLIPLDVTPYSQSVSWVRPESGSAQSVNTWGDR